MEAHHEYRVHAFGAGGRNGVVGAEGVLSSMLARESGEIVPHRTVT